MYLINFLTGRDTMSRSFIRDMRENLFSDDNIIIMEFFDRYIIRKQISPNRDFRTTYRISLDENIHEAYFMFYDLNDHEKIDKKYSSLIVDDEIYEYVQIKCL